MIDYIKKLCVAMFLFLTALFVAVAVELMLAYFQSGMLRYIVAAVVAAFMGMRLCYLLMAAFINAVTDIVIGYVIKNCGKTAENKLENH